MKKNYVIINTETNGFFNFDDNKQLIFIEAIKVDENLNKIDEFKTYIKPKEKLSDKAQELTGITNEILDTGKNENEAILEFIKFCESCSIITHNAKFELSFILKALYKNKITSDFNFKYIDIKDIMKSKEDIIGKLTLNNIKRYYKIKEESDLISILNIIKAYLKDNCMTNLKDLFHTQPFHGKIFRGLNYPKYMCNISVSDNKYYGYIVDFTPDKYVSFHAFLKELNNEYFSYDEITKLKEKGAKVIMNVSYLCDESVTFTDYYSVQAVDSSNVTSDCKKLINGINNFVKYNKKEKKLKLVLWGTLELLKQTYKIIDKDTLEEFISLIDIIKEPWDYWTDEDLKILDMNVKI